MGLILVTGAGGFIGQNLAEYLQAKGFDVLAPSQQELDLTDNLAVEAFFAAHQIETIVHCATIRREGTDYPPNTCEYNLRMFFNLERMLKPKMRLISLGSGSEYDRCAWRRKMPEDYFGRRVPSDGHSYAKYLISKYIELKKDPALVCFRLFGVFGKYEDYRYKFISNAIVKNLLGLPITINQNVIYDYLYIVDFCRIIERFISLSNPTGRTVYNVTPTEPIDLISLARMINKASGRQSEIKVLNEGIGVEYSGDNSRLLAELGDFRFTAPEKAIAELIVYYRSILGSLDAETVKKDPYLGYAQQLRNDYFLKNREK